MARRERTTALPKARVKPQASRERGFAGLDWSEQQQRFAILGGAVALLLVILGFIAYYVYDQRVATPNKVVLAVGAEDVKLSYYAGRLGPFVQANARSGSSVQLLEDDMLNKLEREALIVQAARGRGIALGDNDVQQFIATQLGVPVGGSGSSFDTLYRNQLRTQKMSDANFRRMKRAELAETKLKDAIKADVGDKGDQYTLQVVALTAKDAADKIVDRAKKGEDLGTLAQTESLDPTSRQKNGLNPPEPFELLPESIRKAIEAKQPGELLGPVQVQEIWWVFRIDRKEPLDYSDVQKDQLSSERLDALVKKQREELASSIRRDLNADDIKWAEQHAN
jgi:parvulin-like peptidyl-prolyl isomerase